MRRLLASTMSSRFGHTWIIEVEGGIDIMWSIGRKRCQVVSGSPFLQYIPSLPSIDNRLAFGTPAGMSMPMHACPPLINMSPVFLWALVDLFAFLFLGLSVYSLLHLGNGSTYSGSFG
ncbi:hypothetical protein GALMADRAFT_575251 [Galerina marginata CBS 339.88]|uniref:Uncharacterized protein n=1 Tax=Galerina marginata (strain CBS 339.88) TaxID=685588 RepID=A0A067STM1_GALM3|nr:hypothetical protein GALMADRAFT_575251 [Galerina marginata CBS 339.88]